MIRRAYRAECIRQYRVDLRRLREAVHGHRHRPVSLQSTVGSHRLLGGLQCWHLKTPARALRRLLDVLHGAALHVRCFVHPHVFNWVLDDLLHDS
jgi:hypothetical protein